MIRKTLRAACQHVRISPYEGGCVRRLELAEGCHLRVADPKMPAWTWD